MIYFNNAATSYPKPDVVIQAVSEELSRPPANPYRDNVTVESSDARCRERLAELFNAPHPNRIILCSGATEALNIAINGLISRNVQVITTEMEHNSVLRPLFHLRDKGLIKLIILPVHPDEGLSVHDLIQAFTPDTGLVVVNHASNVTNFITDIASFYQVCEERGAPLLIDASQSAGSVDIDVSQMPNALWVFTGHKALLGPEGTGGLLVGGDRELIHWKVGGTGIHSELEGMPNQWPIKYEAGTMNFPGLAGLARGAEYIQEQGQKNLTRKKSDLALHLTRELAHMDGITIQTAADKENPCGIVSFILADWEAKEVGYILMESFGIRVRTGLHCAPLIHRALGTLPQGTIRVSLSAHNTYDEVEMLLKALATIIKTK